MQENDFFYIDFAEGEIKIGWKALASLGFVGFAIAACIFAANYH